MLYYKGKNSLNLVPTAGLEPARPIKPRDFKSLVSTIPPRGQEPDFYTCRYFKFQPPNSVTFTSTGRFIIKSAERAHASYLKEPQFILEPNAVTCYGCRRTAHGLCYQGNCEG